MQVDQYHANLKSQQHLVYFLKFAASILCMDYGAFTLVKGEWFDLYG